MINLSSLLLSFAFAIVSFLSFGQITAVHSSMSNMNVCQTQSGNITFMNTGNFDPSDSVFLVLPSTSAVTYSNFVESAGTLTQSNDTVIVFGLPATDSLVITYSTTYNCDALNLNSFTASNSYTFALNQGSWVTQTSNNYIVSSPVLNYLGGDQLNYANAMLGLGTTRSFYYTNTNSAAPFNGIIEFRDTLPHNLSTSSVTLDTVYLGSSNGNVLSYNITDSAVSIVVQVMNLQLGDTLKICDVAFLNDCVVLESNVTKYDLNYGCVETDLCKEITALGVTFKTTLNFDPNDKPSMQVLARDIHHEACYSDTVIRTEMFRNNGPGAATGVFIRMRDRLNEFGVTFLDTTEISIYLNSVSALNELSYTTNVNTSTADDFIFDVIVTEIIPANDTIILVYREINKCIDSSEYDYYYNNSIGMHDIWMQARFQHPCFPTGFANSGNVTTFHKYGLNQQFNNLIGTVSDFEENWFEVENVGDFTVGGGTSANAPFGIAYDLENSLIEVELLLESGLSLSSTDSLLFCSNYNGVTSYLPLEGITIDYGLPGVDQTDTVRARFSFPSTFQEPNNGSFPSPAAPAHYPFKKTPVFYQFFSNSSIKFKLKAFCDSVAPDSKAMIQENFFYIIDTNCNECKLPLASVEDEVNILCPGCILPGWNLTQMDVFRKNIGYEDTDNDHYPEGFAPLTANIADVSSQSVIIGDTLEFALEGFISDGDPVTGFTFGNIGFVYDEGQFLFKGNIDKLKFIDGEGTFIEGNVSTPFYVPPGSDDVYSDSAVGIDMSIASLNSYGVTGITNYNDSCSIIFNPRFKVIDNYDDGLGSNPYIDLKNITTFYLMGGIEFGAPDILADANTTPIDTIANMTPAERDSLSYWCVGFDGRFIGVGVDFYNSLGIFAYSTATGVPYAGCLYRISETVAGMVGDKFLIGATGNGPGAVNPNNLAPYPFQNELRDLYNVDSVRYTYPPTIEAYEMRFVSSAFRIDTITFNSQWAPYNNLVSNNSSLFTTTPTSVTVYPEQLIHTNTDYVSMDNHLTYDENTYLQHEVYLRNTDCPIDSVVPIPTLTIEKYMSNYPGTLTGDTVITTVIAYGNNSVGVGNPATNEFFQHDPEFNVSANPIPASVNGNIGFEIGIDLDVFLPYSNLAAIINANINVAPNSFMVFQSPNGNFTNINVPNVDRFSTNYSNNVVTTTSVTPTPALLGGDPYLELGRLGGRTDRNQSRLVDLFATYDCSTVLPGEQDSLYVIYGWNCFDYPDTLENACFIDTFVLYISPPNTGLDVQYGIQDSISLCDTLHFTADFNATGQGDVNNVTVEIFNQNGQAVDYVPGSGQISYDGNTDPVDPTITPNSYLWILDSLNTPLQDFNGLSPNALFSADLLTACGLTDDTLFIRMSGTNYCGQIIYEDTFELTPQTFTDLPVHDSLLVSGDVGSFVTCSDTNTVTVTVNNIGSSPSNTYNEVLFVFPSGYEYVSGGSPIYNSNDTIVIPISTSIASGGSQTITFEITKSDSTCTRKFLNAQLLLNSPYYCDTNECFYSSVLPGNNITTLEVDPGGLNLTTIDPAAMCSGINEITFDFTSLDAGTIEVFDANTSTYLGQGNYSNTNGSGGQFTVSLTDSSSNLYFVNVSACCPDTIYYAFDCDTICQADASFDITNYCLGDTISVTSTETLGTHEWSYSYFGLTGTGMSASFPASQSGTFAIQHIFNADCGASDTVIQTFEVYSPIQSSIVLNGTNPICQPDSVLLSVQNSSNYTDFLWTNGQTTPSIWVSTAGTYGVSIVDSNGCSNDCQAITVSTSIAPTPIIETIYICSPTEAVQLEANNGPNVTWFDNSTGQFNTVTGPGQYTATVCDNSSNCCVTNVYNVILSEFTFDIPDTISCAADSTLISTNFSANSYTWSNGNTGSSSYYLEDGTHWLTATDSLGCSYTDTFTITITILPISDFTIEDTICTSDSITCLYPAIDDASFNHHWIFDFGSYQYHNYTSSPCFDFGNLGTFPITHIVTNACGSDTTVVDVTVIEYDSTANIVLIGQNPFCSGDSVQLTPSSGFVSIEWYNGIGNYLGDQDTLTVFIGGVYAATVTDSNGCTKTILATVNENPTPPISLGAIVNPSSCNSSTGSIEVTGAGTGTVSWTGTSSGNAASVTLPYLISGLSAGNYTITFTTNGCPSSAISATLVDPPLPNVIATGTTTICSGDSTIITASGASTYSWDNGAGTNATVAVSPTSTTTYTVTGTTNACSNTDQVTITVENGVTFTQNVSFCEGDSISVGGSFYDSAGIYHDTLQAANSCDSIVTTIITVINNPTLTQNIEICEGDSINIQGNYYTNSATYVDTVMSPAAACDSIITTVLVVNPSSSSTDSVEICEGSSYTILGSTYSSAGTYMDTTTNAVGCDSIITTVLIVNPTPIVSIIPTLMDTMCIEDGNVGLLGDPSGGVFSGPGVSGSIFDPNMAGEGPHTISYTYTDSNGCVASSNVIVVVQKCAGIFENSLEGVTLYPNPNDGIFNITGLEIGTEFEIYDSRGRLVAEGIVQSDEEEIVLKDAQTGIYYLYATQNGAKGSLKFLITK